ncbi:MAG: biotin--[acetyl-CoA-carboxylase] ligase [Bacilli bacterium]
MAEQINYIYFDEIDSTNLYLKKNYQSIPANSVVSTGFQNNGRGRYDRSFVSSRNQNVLFSILLKDKFSFDNFENICLLSGAAVSMTLAKNHIKSSIKWPNDILINGKKTCGILLEGVSTSVMQALIVGIGLNVNQMAFNNLPNATSMKLESGVEFNTKKLLVEIVDTFFMLLNDLKKGKNSFIDYVKENNYYKDKEVGALLNGEKVRIKVLDILNDSHLLIELNGEKKEVNNCELTFHIK